jgi:hypothetical protein
MVRWQQVFQVDHLKLGLVALGHAQPNRGIVRWSIVNRLLRQFLEQSLRFRHCHFLRFAGVIESQPVAATQLPNGQSGAQFEKDSQARSGRGFAVRS